jgi:hypothetical protein
MRYKALVPIWHSVEKAYKEIGDIIDVSHLSEQAVAGLVRARIIEPALDDPTPRAPAPKGKEGAQP